MDNKIFLDLENCANILDGRIEIQLNKLNILHGINGVGKSTVIKALEGFINKNDSLVDELKPFCGSLTPTLSGQEDFSSIKIFNNKYVDQFLYKEDDLIQNSFEILIKTEDYDTRVDEINSHLKVMQNEISENESLLELIGNLEKFADSIKIKKDGTMTDTCVFSKAYKSGNILKNIPNELMMFKSLIENVQWADWHQKGASFSSELNHCPYCGDELTKKSKEIIDKTDRTYIKSTIQNLSNMVSTLESLSSIFNDEVDKQIEVIKNNNTNLNEEHKNYLVRIKEEANDFLKKLLSIKNINAGTFRNVKFEDIEKYLIELKINIDLYKNLKNDNSIKLSESINGSINSVLEDIGQLKGSVIVHQKNILKNIESYEKEINEFLEYAGLKYYIKIVESLEKYKMNIYPINKQDEIIGIEKYLSYGEKNVFSIVLFFFDVLSSNPDLVVLDDPISSFDSNKKFAILHKLFTGKKSLYGKTVFLLTHDFETVLNIVYIKSDIFNSIAFYLENDNGNLTYKQIRRENISSYIEICKENINASNCSFIKIIHLRRLFDLERFSNSDIDIVWNYCSSILHRKEKPDINDKGVLRSLNVQEIKNAEDYLSNYIPKINYSSIISEFSKENLVNLYFQTDSNYEKLQIFRALSEDDTSLNPILCKFINETYHPENEYLYSLNPLKFERVPYYIIEMCTDKIRNDNLLKKFIQK